MFDQAFATLFRAVDRVRVQLETADAELRELLAEELHELRHLGNAYVDHWLALDEQIVELMDSYDLLTMSESVSPDHDASELHGWPDSESLGFGAQLPLDVTTEISGRGSAPRPGNAIPIASAHGSKQTLQGTESGPVPELDWVFLSSEPITAAFRKGMGYFDLLLFDEAATALRQVVQAAPNPVSRIYLAASLSANQFSEEALVQLTMARESTDDERILCAANEVEAHLRFGVGDVAGAIACLEDSALRMPEYQDVWYNLGVCLATQGAFSEASYVLAQAVALDPDDVDAICLLAEVQLRDENAEAARQMCEQATSRVGRHPRVLEALCRIYFHLREESRCLALCRQLVDAYPHLSTPWRLAAWTLVRRESPDQALALLKKRLATAPDDAQSLLQLGVVYLLRQDYDRAESVILRSLPKSADKAMVWIILGRVSAANRLHAKAHRRYLRALRDPRRSVKRLALYYAGLSLADAGRLREAEKYLQAALVLGTANPAILIALGRTVDRLGRHSEADKLFSRAEESVGASYPVSGL